jgi:uncharacterized protein (DUF2252 family)
MTKQHTPTSVLKELARFNRARKPRLVRLKYERMAENPFAFFRGTDHLFAWHWREVKPPDVGPAILISGDLHLENFGAYADDQGEFLYDINDFDEALIAPCSLDLVRCTTSILLASTLWQLTPVQATGIALVFLDHYRLAIAKVGSTGKIGEVKWGKGEGPLWDLLGATALANPQSLLERFTHVKRSGLRQIVRSPDRFPKVNRKRAALIVEAVERYGRRHKAAKAFRVLDVTGRIAGIGSLGVRRYTVLVIGEGGPEGNRLLELKEAWPSSLLPCTDHRQPDTGGDEARRMVDAQCQLQARPTRGLDVIEVDGRPYRMRELIPDENRSRLSRLQKEPEKLRRAVAVAGQLTAWSQLRGSRLPGEDRTTALTRWATGPALESVLAAAARCADRTLHDYQVFEQALADGRLKVQRK